MSTLDFRDSETHSPNREELLQLAIRAARNGNRESARVMFRQILEEDRRNERAMLWMAKLATSKAERRQWLNRVLVVNPHQQIAKEALRRMDYKNKAHDNRVLVIFGFIAALLVIVGVISVIVILSMR
ncbi:MAG: hypothetical protein DIU68_018585 [Chloroflexota bacterium]|nr:MAG: hypothetical protein DIU68_00540 [Chloroflexota bacterium]